MLVKVMQGQYSIATAPQTRPIVVDSEYTAYLITLMASDAITATIKPSTRYITFLLAMVPRAHKLGRYSNTQRGSCDSDDQPTEGVVPKQWYGEASTVLSNTPRLIDSGCHEAVSSHFFGTCAPDTIARRRLVEQSHNASVFGGVAAGWLYCRLVGIGVHHSRNDGICSREI